LGGLLKTSWYLGCSLEKEWWREWRLPGTR